MNSWSVLAFSVCIIVPVLGCIAYLTLAERRIIGFMQGRLGPNRRGPFGLLQPVSDALKLLCKEIIFPQKADKKLFLVAPVLSCFCALGVWAVVPFSESWVLSDLSLGLLYILALASVGVYGLIIAGWASNSRYAFLGAVRCASQVIAYELGMTVAILGVVILTGSLNLTEVVNQQQGGIWHWHVWPLFPLWLIYWISAIAETNRAPFDVVEGESELVAGFHVEYGGMGFALFFLAEYGNMMLVSAMMSLLFWGAWHSPFEGIPLLSMCFQWVPGIVWFILKMAVFLFFYLWIRATFPRYRYDQIMRLGWKVLLPLGLIWVVFLSFLVKNKIL